MKRIVGVFIGLTLFAAGVLVGLFALGGQQSVEGAVPIQIETPDGWLVTNFVSAHLDSNWENPVLKDDCGSIISNPLFGETAKVFVITQTEEFLLEYPRQGSRMTACPGRTAWFPPASSGRIVEER